MYEKATQYLDEIRALSEEELLPTRHTYKATKMRMIPSKEQVLTRYEYNPILWNCLNAWSEEHFIKTVWDETKHMRPADFTSAEWLDNLDEHKANLSLSWLVSNEEYYRGTLAEWVKSGVFMSIFSVLERVDEAS